ncbi:MAG: hypothetical protein L3J71_04880 [Victivallaceae bacterium]|nr:hypothetical protein [Victivallaceae bacterium]
MAKVNIVRKNSMALYNGDDIELFISPDRKNFYQFLVNAESEGKTTAEIESCLV